LYVGVTSNLEQRIFRHKTKYYPTSFSARYNINKLVYFEHYSYILNAIAREKQLKGGSRKQKIALIERENSKWLDLASDLDLEYY
jgi:putative endonuclease